LEKDLWLSTDEALEAVVSLEMVSHTLPKVIENLHYWKWVLIALHNALQGYMVLALKGPDSLNVLTKKCAQEWRAARERGDDVYPERRLVGFLNLYKKIQRGRKLYDERVTTGRWLPRGSSDLMLMYNGSQPFKPQGTQNESVRMLSELRNQFVHFLPTNLALGVHGLPRVVADCTDIIDFLVCECGTILWYDTSLEQRSKELISQVRKDLDPLKGSYDE